MPILPPEPPPEAPAEAPPQEEKGSGSFLFGDGSKYDGEFLKIDGVMKRHGRGTLIDGDRTYEGDWVMDKMHGKGMFRYSSGAVYEGDWADNQYEGRGKYTWNDGSYYEGEWKANKMHGEGVYIDVKGVMWRGRYYNGTGPGLLQGG
eukprot:tig00000227_g19838.t1